MEDVVEHGRLEGGVGLEGLVPGAGDGGLNDGQDTAGDGFGHDGHGDIIQQVVGADGGIRSRDSESCSGEEQSGKGLVLHGDDFCSEIDGGKGRIVSDELLVEKPCGMRREGVKGRNYEKQQAGGI